MAREVNETQPYQDKLVKLIPTEIVGAYMVLAGMLGFGPVTDSVAEMISDDDLKKTLIQLIFFVLLLLTPIYLRSLSKVTNKLQLAATTVSYVIWVYTLGGPFVVWGWYHPLIGSVLLVLWALIAPLIVPPAQPAQPLQPVPTS